MLSRTLNVIHNKHKVDKALQARHKNELLNVKQQSAYKARLYDELKHVEVMLQDPDVDAVIVEIPQKMLPQFSAAIYAEDLASYDVQQMDNQANKFYIRRKFVAF